MKKCKSCDNNFPNSIKIEGKIYRLHKRTFCHECISVLINDENKDQHISACKYCNVSYELYKGVLYRHQDKCHLNPSVKTETKLCIQCNDEIEYERRWSKFCCNVCSTIWRSIFVKKNRKFYKINWNDAQADYDSGLLLNDILVKYNISYGTIKKAKRLGFFNNIENELHRETKKKRHKEGIDKSLLEGKFRGWTTKKTERSYPEKYFSGCIIKNKLNEQYTILEQVQASKYTLDFVFVELKLDVEIDGSQHFYKKKVIESDKRRNEYLINNGWKVYRIAWSDMVKNSQKEINEFLDYLKNIHNNTNRFYKIEDIKKEKKIYKKQKDYFDEIREKNILKNKPKVDLVLNSEIDFFKQGWVQKTSIIIGIQPQRVNKWMKRYMPEFYEKKCFKRQNRNGESHKRKYGNRETFLKIFRQNSFLKLNEKIKLISDTVNFNKKGWIKEIQKIIKYSDRASTYKWIKDYMPHLRIYVKNSNK